MKQLRLLICVAAQVICLTPLFAGDTLSSRPAPSGSIAAIALGQQAVEVRQDLLSHGFAIDSTLSTSDPSRVTKYTLKGIERWSVSGDVIMVLDDNSAVRTVKWQTTELTVGEIASLAHELSRAFAKSATEFTVAEAVHYFWDVNSVRYILVYDAKRGKCTYSYQRKV